MNLDVFLSPTAWLVALGIFAMRMISLSLDTVRILFIIRGRKAFAWLAGFFAVLLFVVAFSIVVGKNNNPLNIIGYCAGVATGTVTGMILEDVLALGYIQLNIISPAKGQALSEEIRQAGFAVTEVVARGKDGFVTLLRCDVLRKDVEPVEAIIQRKDPSAFVTAVEIRPIRRGFWRKIAR